MSTEKYTSVRDFDEHGFSDVGAFVLSDDSNNLTIIDNNSSIDKTVPIYNDDDVQLDILYKYATGLVRFMCSGFIRTHYGDERTNKNYARFLINQITRMFSCERYDEHDKFHYGIYNKDGSYSTLTKLILKKYNIDDWK